MTPSDGLSLLFCMFADLWTLDITPWTRAKPHLVKCFRVVFLFFLDNIMFRTCVLMLERFEAKRFDWDQLTKCPDAMFGSCNFDSILYDCLSFDLLIVLFYGMSFLSEDLKVSSVSLLVKTILKTETLSDLFNLMVEFSEFEVRALEVLFYSPAYVWE